MTTPSLPPIEAPSEPTVATAATEVQVGAGIDWSDPNSPLAPFYLTWNQVFAVGLLAILFLFLQFIPIWHTDIWAHMRFGQWIWEHGENPSHEPFCPWSDPKQPFVQFYTLSQLAFYGVYSLGTRFADSTNLEASTAAGATALIVFHASLQVLKFSLLLAAFYQVSKSLNTAIFGVFVVLVLSANNMAVQRPQVIGEVFFALLLYWMSRPAFPSKQDLWQGPMLFVFWANCHGSFTVGLVVLIILMLQTFFQLAQATLLVPYSHQAIPEEAAQHLDQVYRRLTMHFLVILLSILAIGCANPEFFEIFRATLAIGNNSNLLSSVSEWQPLAFSLEKGWHQFFMASLLLAALSIYYSSRYPTLSSFLLFGFFAIACSSQQRFQIWWAMLYPWVLVPYWRSITLDTTEPAETDSNAGSVSETEPPPNTEERPSFKKTCVAIALIWMAGMWSLPIQAFFDGKFKPLTKLVSDGTPWQLAEQLLEPAQAEPHFPKLQSILQANYPEQKFVGAIFATPMQGDYLMWRLAPDIPVSYTHMHLFPSRFWQEVGNVVQAGPGWREWLEQNQINMIVVEAENFPPNFIQPNLPLVVQIRDDKRWEVLLDETGVDSIYHLNRQFIAVRKQPLY